MNEFEKRAIRMLSEEERGQIVGGTAETEELTNEQCENLRSAISKLSEEKQMQIAGEQGIPIKEGIKEAEEPPHIIMCRYGAPKLLLG